MLCDMSTDTPHPYVPQPFQRTVFDALHYLSHPGIRATQCLVTAHYIWPGINTDVCHWARSCIQCQCTKVHQHTVTPLGSFSFPDERFDHVHINIVGPFPTCKGYSYLLTCVDHFLMHVLIMSTLISWDLSLLVRDILIYLLVWITLLDGLKPFRLLTPRHPQSPTLSSPAGSLVMEHHPPSPLTMVPNSNPNCGTSSCAYSEPLESEPWISPCHQMALSSAQSWLEHCAAKPVDWHTATRSFRTPVCF